MLRQAGQVNTAKNMKFREMVNTADYQVSVPSFPPLQRRSDLCVPRNQTARPLSQFLRQRSFLSGNIFFIFSVQYICSYTYFITTSCVYGSGSFDVSRDENRLYQNRIYVFPVLIPTFMYVCVSDLYIPRIGPHIWLQQNRQTDLGNI
jgi:hypothetical protein